MTKHKANGDSKSERRNDALSLDGAQNRRELAETFCASGAEALAEGDFDEAFDAYKRAAKLDPNSPKPRIGVGQVWLSYERYDLALEEAQAAIKLDKNLGKLTNFEGTLIVSSKNSAKPSTITIARSNSINAPISLTMVARSLAICSAKSTRL